MVYPAKHETPWKDQAMTKFSAKLSDQLIKTLFVRKEPTADCGSVQYLLKETSKMPRAAAQEFAQQTWAVHGICLSCGKRSITVGRCAECDRQYSDLAVRGWNLEREVSRQCDIAAELVAGV